MLCNVLVELLYFIQFDLHMQAKLCLAYSSGTFVVSIHQQLMSPMTKSRNF